MDSEFVLSADFSIDIVKNTQPNLHILTHETFVTLITDDKTTAAFDAFNSDYKMTHVEIEDLKLLHYVWHYTDNYRLLIIHANDKKPQTLRKLGVLAVDQLRLRKITDVVFNVSKDFTIDELKHYFQSVILWNYKFEMKTINRTVLIESMIFNLEGNYPNVDELEFYKVATKSTLFVRDFNNTRANIATPQYFEDLVRHVVKDAENVQNLEVITGKELYDKGLRIIYSVGKGNPIDPRLIQCLYKGNPDSDEVEYAIVGKGITFDCGGVNVKAHPEDMYCDKTGACTTLGVLKGLIELKLKVNVAFTFAIAENSIDGNSYRPSDIIKSYKGYTVEVANTDSEGRLVLIDAFAYVQEVYKPKNIIDLASLTGNIFYVFSTHHNYSVSIVVF